MSLVKRPVGERFKWLAAWHDGEENSGVNDERPWGGVEIIRRVLTPSPRSETRIPAKFVHRPSQKLDGTISDVN